MRANASQRRESPIQHTELIDNVSSYDRTLTRRLDPARDGSPDGRLVW